MPSRQQEPLLRISNFEILIGDREVGFAQVGRLTSATDPDGPPERGTNRWETVLLRRALTTSTELYDWRRRIVDGGDDRRDVTIRLLSAPGGKVVNAWRLVGAWPCRWSGPAFDARNDDVAIEELELAFDDLVWINHNRSGTGG
jgi:hypothetical protein